MSKRQQLMALLGDLKVALADHPHALGESVMTAVRDLTQAVRDMPIVEDVARPPSNEEVARELAGFDARRVRARVGLDHAGGRDVTRKLGVVMREAVGGPADDTVIPTPADMPVGGETDCGFGHYRLEKDGRLHFVGGPDGGQGEVGP